MLVGTNFGVVKYQNGVMSIVNNALPKENSSRTGLVDNLINEGKTLSEAAAILQEIDQFAFNEWSKQVSLKSANL